MHGSTRSFIRSVGVYNLAPLLAGGITSTWEAQDASAALSALPVTGGDLVFVGSERRQHLALLALWDLEEVQGPSEFCCELIEFCGGDP